MNFARSSAFRRRRTSIPPSLGILRSSRMSRGWPPRRWLKAPSRNTNSIASTPSRSRTTLLTRLLLRSARMMSSASASLSSTSKISTASKSSTLISSGQCEREHRAVIHLAFGPHSSAVPGNHAVDDGKSHSRAAELVGAMQSLEYAKQLPRVFHVEADAVVADGVVILRTDLAAADLDERPCCLAAVLDRIGNEIRPHLAQQAAVAAGGRQRPHFDMRTSRRFAAFAGRLCMEDFLDDFAHQRVDVHLAMRHRLASQPGERQQVIDEDLKSTRLNSSHMSISYA